MNSKDTNDIDEVDTVSKLKFETLPLLEQKRDEIVERIERFRVLSEHKTVLLTDTITPSHIMEARCVDYGYPDLKLTQSDSDRLLSLRERLEQRVIGQDDAVISLSNAVLRNRAGFSADGRPSGSCVFLGSTGVGKTELAKALAEQLFDDEKAIIRVDCSEYMEKHSVSRLIGAPPGYIGFDSGGQLTDAVSRHPYSVVLIDEADKAHRDVFNLFLQILDDGRLTDSKGNVVDFKHCYIIFTSNLGYHHLSAGGMLSEDIKSQVLNGRTNHFRPEFLNRLDDIIVFSPLSKSSLMQIASLFTGKSSIEGRTRYSERHERTPSK